MLQLLLQFQLLLRRKIELRDHVHTKATEGGKQSKFRPKHFRNGLKDSKVFIQPSDRLLQPLDFGSSNGQEHTIVYLRSNVRPTA